MVEEKLFGVEDGTGVLIRVGALEEAHGGTLFIDEVATADGNAGADFAGSHRSNFRRIGGSKSMKSSGGVVKP